MFQTYCFYSSSRAINWVGRQIDWLSGYYVSINDPWIEDGRGRTGGWVAMHEMTSRINSIVYVPGDMYEPVRDFVLKHKLNIRVIGQKHPDAYWYIVNAKSICKCAALTQHDVHFIRALSNRDNSFNTAQGQVGVDLTFRLTEKNTGLTADMLNAYFPNQYNSNLTKQKCLDTIQRLPPELRNIVEKYSILSLMNEMLMERSLGHPDLDGSVARTCKEAIEEIGLKLDATESDKFFDEAFNVLQLIVYEHYTPPLH